MTPRTAVNDNFRQLLNPRTAINRKISAIILPDSTGQINGNYFCLVTCLALIKSTKSLCTHFNVRGADDRFIPPPPRMRTIWYKYEAFYTAEI
jgi:hypothetical protein